MKSVKKHRGWFILYPASNKKQLLSMYEINQEALKWYAFQRWEDPNYAVIARQALKELEE